MNHLNTACSYISKYTARVNEVIIQWTKYLAGEKLKPYRDIRSFFNSCNEFLTVAASKVEKFSRMNGSMKENKDIDAKQSNELN